MDTHEQIVAATRYAPTDKVDVTCSNRRPRLIAPYAVGPHALARGRHTLYGRVPVEVIARVMDRLRGIRRIKPRA